MRTQLLKNLWRRNQDFFEFLNPSIVCAQSFITETATVMDLQLYTYDTDKTTESEMGPTSPTPFMDSIDLTGIEASAEGTVNVSEYLTPTTNISSIQFDNVDIDVEDVFKPPLDVSSKVIELQLSDIKTEPSFEIQENITMDEDIPVRKTKGRAPKRKKEEKGSTEYIKKRQKNNESVRKCREKAKERQAETEKTLLVLRDENSKLKSQLAEQTHENRILRQLLHNFVSDKSKDGIDLFKCLNK